MVRVMVVLAAAVVLTGCYASVGPYPGRPQSGPAAVFRHPSTGDTRHCLNHTAQGILLGGVVGGISAGNAFADCKTSLEREGYAREPDTPVTTGDDASQRVFCRQRASNAGGSDAWAAAYWRCMAGY